MIHNWEFALRKLIIKDNKSYMHENFITVYVQYCSVQTTNNDGIIFASVKINYDEDKEIWTYDYMVY